jgi:protein-L-isoaspartate(D-aspartate) O-methyltransferase
VIKDKAMDTTRLSERHVMVKEQLEKRGIHNPWVLQAMLDIPRHLFVSPEDQNRAYGDGPLPIGSGQTISQPFIVASMIELIEPETHQRVLEIGIGSGYSAAVLSRLVAEVYGVEREGSLLAQAAKRFQQLGISKVHVKEGDGSLGWAEKSPFDAILVAAASPRIPPSLISQLKVGGVMVIPVGGRTEGQKLVRVTKRSDTHFQEKELYEVRFVPLIGQEGWENKI